VRAAFKRPDLGEKVRGLVKEGQQGFTLHPQAGTQPEAGFAYSAFPRQEAEVPWNAVGADRGAIKGYTKENAALLEQPGMNLGGWVDPSSWKAELNVSRLAPNEHEAKGMLDLLDQKAAYDIAGQKEVFPDPLPGTSVDRDRVTAWFSDPVNQQRMLELNEAGRALRKNENLPPWWNMYGTPIEEVWGAEDVPEFSKKLAYTAPGQNIYSNMGIANKAMAEKRAGQPYSGTNAHYPSRTREALAKSDQPWTQNPMLTNPKTFSMEMAPFADTSPMDSERFWQDLMGNKGSPDRAAQVEFQKQMRKMMEDNPSTFAKGDLVRDFISDAWSGLEPTAHKSGGLGYQMERRIQNAMENQPMKDVKGYKWVRRPTKIDRDEAIKQMRRGEVWGLMGAPVGARMMKDEEQR
jgi:hypothetical protein